MPCLQFTIKRLMVSVAVVAITLETGVQACALWRRWDFCQSRVKMYAAREKSVRLMISERRGFACFRLKPPGTATPDEIRERTSCANHYAELTATYQTAAHRLRTKEFIHLAEGPRIGMRLSLPGRAAWKVKRKDQRPMNLEAGQYWAC
jgi:hypothetical protein